MFLYTNDIRLWFIFIYFFNGLIVSLPNEKELSNNNGSLELPLKLERKEICYQSSPSYNNGSFINKYQPIDCKITSEKTLHKALKTNLPFTTPSLNQGYTKFDGTNTLITEENTKVKVYLACDESSGNCEKVAKAFKTTALFLENIIEFKQQIVIKASFFSFCKVLEECPTPSSYILGQATPFRLLPVSDETGSIRHYPQALHKQVVEPSTDNATSTNYYEYDIIANFNSEAPFYFLESSKSRPLNKVVFIDTLFHEILHGLGFASSLNDYFEKGLVTFLPDIKAPAPGNDEVNFGSDISDLSFSELIFDKFVYLKNTNRKLSEYLKEFNALKSPYLEDPFFANPKLKTLSRELTKAATIKNNLIFQVNPKAEPIYLESSLYPFKAGSSISHLDKDFYENSQDLLMVYRREGKDLIDVIKYLGDFKTAPYGPHTLAILEAIGYTLNKSPNLDMSYIKLAGGPASKASLNCLPNIPVQLILMFVIYAMSC